MHTHFSGLLIRKERLRRDWSQEGLCNGICAVSYLSKIEQGKAEASPEILSLLLERLGVVWHGEAAEDAARCMEQGYEAVFALDDAALRTVMDELDVHWDVYLNGPSMLDAMILRSWDRQKIDPLLLEYELDLRQSTLLLILQHRAGEAAERNPLPLTCFCSGIALYEHGHYPAAIEVLQHSYDLAAQQGYAYLMASARMFLGNCYSNLLDYDHMLLHYRIAGRLAASVGDKDMLEMIRYNSAATALELGRVQEAYDGLKQLQNPTPIVLHKLAICCEKLDRKAEALSYLDQAVAVEEASPDREIISRLCFLVRFRLEHAGYLHCPEYGEQLLETFRLLRESYPHGYANFHLPWVLEWYCATRQYKKAFDLTQSFPSSTHFS